MLFNYPWASNYEELKTFYPKYYENVVEMQAILAAVGDALDKFMENAQKVFDNCFIDFMDEANVTAMESFLQIRLSKQRTLEERKRLIKSFFVGHGKLSAEFIKRTVSAYTGSDVDVSLVPIEHTPDKQHYEPGANRLYINYLRGDEPSFYRLDIEALLAKLIPAHIDYQISLTYCKDRALYAGCGVAMCKRKTIDCEQPAHSVVYLTDENGDLLADENGNRYIDNEEDG